MKIMVGLSGGVDSAMSAWHLIQSGYQVSGLFMKNWEEDDGSPECTAKEDFESAQKCADVLGIELYTANFSAEYWDQVFEHFLGEYRQNRVPNPDVLCNREIKFGVFLQYAQQLGADKIATGHYAQNTLLQEGAYALQKGIDDNKDQSYFLHALNADQLAKCLFPIGHLHKLSIREQAKTIGLPNHARKDSTGVCFIGERKFKQFLTQYLPQKPGPISTVDNIIVGEHSGLLYYTLGQRKGLMVGGQKNQAEGAWYIAQKRATDNTLVVTQDAQDPLLMASSLDAIKPNWISSELMTRLFPASSHNTQRQFQCFAKLRHRQADQPCTVYCHDDNRLSVTFETPQRAINPGQYVVFYYGRYCLGGAVIDQVNPIQQTLS